MSETGGVERRTADAVETLRGRGAVFGYLHGSRATQMASPAADITRAHREFVEAVAAVATEP